MARSRCVKCDNTTFEIAENSPAGSRFVMYFIQCSKCGAVVGLTDFHNVPVLINELKKKVDSLPRGVDQNSFDAIVKGISHNFNVLLQSLRELHDKIDIK